MSNGLSIYVIVLTVLNVVAAMWLLWWMRKRRDESATTTDTTGHVWDGDLREYNNPLPRWWLWLFVLSVIFSIGYLILYPGMGNNQGTLGWTQQKQWAEMQAEQEKKAQVMLAQFAGRPIEDLSRDPAALKVGRNLFANNCSTCHGSDGGGATGFPNLTDRDWLWGGDAESIRTTIHEGRIGAMPGWEAVLGAAGVENVLAHVLSLSGRQAESGDAAEGQAQFELLCAACHGADGRGQTALGAPNLTDKTWLHGGSAESIRRIIAQGVNNAMPSQGERLGDERVRLLAAYVMSLGDARVAQSGP
jgi:cytochrome c oxidase cbb3-type subunit III